MKKLFQSIMVLSFFGAVFVVFVLVTDDGEPSIYDFHYYAKAMLKDPDSAQFKNERLKTVADSGAYYMCAEINAKNSFGGYSGYKNAIVSQSTLLTDDGSELFSGLWKKQCAY